MVSLPRGNPVKENVDPGRINLPSALEKLRESGFSGYLRFDFAKAAGMLLFEQGRLLDARFEDPPTEASAGDALAGIFDQALSGKGRLNVYRLSAELAPRVRALLHGELLYPAQEVGLVDIGALLNRLKEDALNGCLRIWAGDRTVLIFYRAGKPLGFFHDGSGELETTADLSLSVARLPGARVEVLATREPGASDDLPRSVDLAALWSRAQGKVARRKPADETGNVRAKAATEAEQRRDLLLSLKIIAARHLGKIGGSLVDKEFEKCLAATLDESGLTVFYDHLGKAAKLIAGPSKIETMLDEMQRSVKTILAKA